VVSKSLRRYFNRCRVGLCYESVSSWKAIGWTAPSGSSIYRYGDPAVLATLSLLPVVCSRNRKVNPLDGGTRPIKGNGIEKEVKPTSHRCSTVPVSGRALWLDCMKGSSQSSAAYNKKREV